MRKSKRLYWLFQILSFAISAGFPIAVVWQKFPIMVDKVGTANTVGLGGVLAIAIFCLTFKDTLLPTFKKLLGITSVPPLVGWAVALVVLFGLSKIVTILLDLQVVCFAGLTGSAIGLGCSFVSQLFYPKEKSGEDDVNGETTDG